MRQPLPVRMADVRRLRLSTQVRSILGTLKRNNVKATMFPIGTWARANPSLVSASARRAHHRQPHGDPCRPGIRIDVERAPGARRGARPSSSVRLLRPPGGSGAFSSRLTALAASRGYSLCYSTVDTRDWAGSSTAQMVRKVRYGDDLTPPVQAGGVVLMHFHGAHTAAGLQSVIDAVRARRRPCARCTDAPDASYGFGLGGQQATGDGRTRLWWSRSVWSA